MWYGEGKGCNGQCIDCNIPYFCEWNESDEQIVELNKKEVNKIWKKILSYGIRMHVIHVPIDTIKNR